MGYIWQGFGTTLAVTLVAALIGLVLGFIVAVVKIAAMNNKWMKIPALSATSIRRSSAGRPSRCSSF